MHEIRKRFTSFAPDAFLVSHVHAYSHNKVEFLELYVVFHRFNALFEQKLKLLDFLPYSTKIIMVH